MKRLLIVVLLLFLFTGLFTLPVSAQTRTPTDDEVNAIASQLYCPVCENTPLDVCPTEACRQWRLLIRQQLIEGKSEAEIKQYFVENYGARVLAEPPRTGLNWLVYILPPAIILLGAFILFRTLRSWTRASKQSVPGPPGISGSQDEYIRKLEDELRLRK
jgi:cytochrome c-type biogenesis protein CcmH